MTPHTHDYEFTPLPPATIALRVRDVAAAKAKLEAAGLEVGEVWDSGACNGVGVTDPAGNRILLHRRYAPYPDGTHAVKVERVDFVSVPDAGHPAGEAVLHRGARARGRDRGRERHGVHVRPGDARHLRPVEHRAAVRALARGARAARPGRRRGARRARGARASSSTVRRSRRASASRRGSRTPTGTRSCSTGGSTSDAASSRSTSSPCRRATTSARSRCTARCSGCPSSEFTEGEVETPNVTLSFWKPEEQGEPFVPNENGVALRVADVAAAVEEVRAAGGEVIGHRGLGRLPHGLRQGSGRQRPHPPPALRAEGAS